MSDKRFQRSTEYDDTWHGRCYMYYTCSVHVHFSRDGGPLGH